MGAREALLLLSLVSSCGAGTAGIVAGSGNAGSGAVPVLNSFAVESPKVAPSLLRLDASQAVRVELFYDAGGGEQAMSGLRFGGVDLPRNEVDLSPGTSELEWNFAPALGAGFTQGVRLAVRRGTTLVNGGELTLGLGNDAPEVLSVDQIDVDPDSGEASGTTGIEITVADSSDDVVSVRIEYDVQGDDPDLGWRLARPDLLAPGAPTPAFGIDRVQAASGGTRLAFHWDTDADLEDLERDVRLRFTATDFDARSQPVATGATVESSLFRVDNNAPPIVQLFNDSVITNPDERRGIPIPFRVIDEEGDLVEVIFQWRREGEQFPDLPTDMAELDRILADPELRREHHVCTEYPRYAQGRVIPVDDTHVRLPELAASESWILAGGLEGKTLELMRPSSIPEPITPTWASNPLVAPIAALPIGDGLTALVLDAPGNGRLREIELATGAIVREIATLGPGLPSAMALERGEQAVLVATDLSGVWLIERVELASGAITELIVSDGSQPGPVRGIASLGTHAAVFTAGSVLFSLDYRDPLASQLGTLLSGLATPWGVVADPLPPNRLYLAEREAVTPSGTGRVLAVELDSHGKLPVVVRTEDLQPAHLERPSAFALERHGSRLLIVTNQPGGTSQLVGLDLGAQGRNVSFPIGPPRAGEIASIASSPDELRCASLPREHELLIGGGLEQRRAIVAYESASQEATQDAALQPEARPGRAWRIPADPPKQVASFTGLEAAFVWSSGSDVPDGGPTFIRAIARDDELGLATESRAPKQVRAALDVAPIVLGGPAITDAPVTVAVADLDGDGDQDLVSANGGGRNLTVFFQLSPGIFSAAPLALGGPGVMSDVRSVAAADLDGDGDQDIVSANRGSHNLTVFFQLSPGTFSAGPLALGGPGVTSSPESVAAADLDGDGDQDLVSGSAGNLSVFFQLSPGTFSAAPLALGAAGYSVAAADLDGDGDQDLAAASGSNLTVFFQNSPGSFSGSPLTVGGPGVTSDVKSVAAADLDGDGDQDLVSGNRHHLAVFFQLSPGSFSASPVALGGPGVNFISSVATADLDGDGDLDLVSAYHDLFFSQGNLTFFFQLSPGSFAAAPLVVGGPGITNAPLSVAAADLDGDGDQDLVSANFDGDNLTVFFQGSPGSFLTSPLMLGGQGVTTRPLSVAVADLDGDGDLDLVSANNDAANLTVFFQLSPGSFSASPLVLGGSGSSVAAADLDGDGDQDLVSANGGGSNLTVFFQLSSGSFSASPLVLGGSGRSVAAADLDGDGDQDLVSANLGVLTGFFQVSPGNFSVTPLAFGTASTVTSLLAADLDDDGDMDVVSAGDNDLRVFFQLSPGSFSASPLVLGGSGVTSSARSVAAADLDGDGDLDLVSANGFPENLTVFFQLSPGSFSASPLRLGAPGVMSSPRSVAVADLDGDGDQDLVSANDASHNLTAFFQLSPGSFSAFPLVLGSIGVTNRATSVAAADLDGDGDQDLVSANGFPSDNLTVFWGGR